MDIANARAGSTHAQRPIMATPLAPSPLADQSPHHDDSPGLFEVSLGVESEIQMMVDARGAVTGVFVPHRHRQSAGKTVGVVLTLGVLSEPVEGLVAWEGESGPMSRRTAGLGITFPKLTQAQRAMLERGRLLHECIET